MIRILSTTYDLTSKRSWGRVGTNTEGTFFTDEMKYRDGKVKEWQSFTLKIILVCKIFLKEK